MTLGFTDYEFGKLCGEITIAALLLAGIIAAVRAARRPGAGRLCIHSLTLLLGSMLLACLCASHLPEGPSPWRQLRVLWALTFFCGILASLVLAIVGLATFKPPLYRGRGYAVAATVMSSIMLAIAAFQIIVKLSNRPEPPADIPAALNSSGDGNVGGKDVQTFNDLNFRYRAPGNSYVLWDAKSLNPAVTLAYNRARPQTGLMIIAEKMEEQVDLTSEALVEISRAQIKSLSSDARLSDPSPCTINGMKGVRYEADLTLSGRKLTYVHWDFARNGFLYQVIVFGRREDKTLVASEFQTLAPRFELINPDRLAGTRPARVNVGLVDREAFGVSCDLRGKSWLNWPEMEQTMPHAVIGGTTPDDSTCFAVIPILYGKNKPSEEALGHVLLATVADYPDKQKDTQPFDGGSLHGFTASHTRLIDKMNFMYRDKIIFGRNCAYLVTVWSTTEKGLESTSREVFDSITIRDIELPPAGKSLSEKEKKSQADMLNSAGMYCFNVNHMDQALPLFEAANAWDAGNKSYVLNMLIAMARLNRLEDTLAVVEKLPPDLRRTDEVQAWEAFCLKGLGQTDQAAEIYQKLFKAGYRDDNDFKEYIALLSAGKQWQQAQDAFEDYLKGSDSIDLKIERAKLYSQAGKDAQAAEYLEQLQKSGVTDPRMADAMVNAYCSIGQPKKALAVCEGMIARGHKSSHVYYLKGLAEWDLKWYRQAKTSLEQALQSSPKDADVKALLQQVSGMLGEGDNSSIKNAIEPVPLPEEIASKLPELGAKCPKEGFGAYYHYWLMGFSYQKDKEYKSTRRYRVVVEDAGAVSKFSTLEFDFDPLSEEIYVNDLTVRDSSGQVVSRGKQDDYYVVDRQRTLAVSHDKTVCLPVPNLQPGHILELTVTTRQLGKPSEFRWYRQSFVYPRPMLLAGAYYLGDEKEVRHSETRIERPLAIKGGLAWLIKDAPIFKFEARQASVEEWAPVLAISDAGGNWEKLGGDYLGEIKDRLSAGEKVSALAQRLTEGAKTPQEKIARLAAHLQKNCVYRPIEFGRRARIPNSPEQTLSNGYGDCKDQAVLLRAMLQSVGVTSQLAVLSSSWNLQEQMPTLDQFDHMILWVSDAEGGKGGCFLDPTERDMALGATPQGLAGRTALILEEGKIRLAKIPEYDSRGAAVQVNSDVRVVDETRLEVVQTVKLMSYAAAWIRAGLKDIEPADQAKYLQIEMFGEGATVESAEVSNLFDNSKDLEMKLKITLNRRCRPAQGGLSVRLAPTWEHYLLHAEASPQRQTPFEVLYPTTVDSTMTLRLPQGRSWADTGPEQEKGSTPAFDWQTSSAAKGDALEIRFHGKLKPGVYPAAKYDEFQSAVDKALQSVGRDVLLGKAQATRPASGPAE